MKMSYLLHATKRRHKNPFKRVLIVLCVVIVLGYIAKDLIISTFVLAGNAINSVVTFIMPSGLRSKSELVEENNILRQKVVELTAFSADRDVLADENRNLKFLLGRKDGSTSTKQIPKSKNILGVIKEGPANTPFDTFIVDVGTENGVAIDDKVLYGNLIIGKVVDVGDLFAKIELFSSPGNTFSGTIQGTKIKVDAKGLGGGMFEVLVPEGVPTKVGDGLVLSSISTKVFGIVKSIEDRQSEGFKRLLFTLPVNPNQISNVLIEK